MFRKIIQAFAAFALIAGVTIGVAQTTTSNSVTWSWSAPTQYVDGTPIASGTAITYKVFTGASTGSESSTPAWTGTATSASTSGYAGGSSVYGYVEACINSLCSAPSSEASKSFPLPAPAAPSNFTAK